MTTRTYGFARPLKYEQVQAGMLISAEYGSRHVLGIAFEGDREMLLAVFDDGGEIDPRPPYIIELTDVHRSITQVVGDRELEPADNYSFDLLPQRRTGTEGFVITSAGSVGIAVIHNDFGTKQLRMIDFDTGLPLDQGGQIALLPPSRLFVVEPGRNERREVVAKLSD